MDHYLHFRDVEVGSHRIYVTDPRFHIWSMSRKKCQERLDSITSLFPVSHSLQRHSRPQGPTLGAWISIIPFLGHKCTGLMAGEWTQSLPNESLWCGPHAGRWASLGVLVIRIASGRFIQVWLSIRQHEFAGLGTYVSWGSGTEGHQMGLKASWAFNFSASFGEYVHRWGVPHPHHLT